MKSLSLLSESLCEGGPYIIAEKEKQPRLYLTYFYSFVLRPFSREICQDQFLIKPTKLIFSDLGFFCVPYPTSPHFLPPLYSTVAGKMGPLHRAQVWSQDQGACLLI